MATPLSPDFSDSSPNSTDSSVCPNPSERSWNNPSSKRENASENPWANDDFVEKITAGTASPGLPPRVIRALQKSPYDTLSLWHTVDIHASSYIKKIPGIGKLGVAAIMAWQEYLKMVEKAECPPPREFFHIQPDNLSGHMLNCTMYGSPCDCVPIVYRTTLPRGYTCETYPLPTDLVSFISMYYGDDTLEMISEVWKTGYYQANKIPVQVLVEIMQQEFCRMQEKTPPNIYTLTALNPRYTRLFNAIFSKNLTPEEKSLHTFLVLGLASEAANELGISKRNAQIFHEYHIDPNVTYQTLAEKYGISRQRVQQIVFSVKLKISQFYMGNSRDIFECVKRFAETQI